MAASPVLEGVLITLICFTVCDETLS